jgi:hypothetical protein
VSAKARIALAVWAILMAAALALAGVGSTEPEPYRGPIVTYHQ